MKTRQVIILGILFFVYFDGQAQWASSLFHSATQNDVKINGIISYGQCFSAGKGVFPAWSAQIKLPSKKEKQQEEIVLYPNPAQSYVEIHTKPSEIFFNGHITIYKPNGQVVHSLPFTESIPQIDLRFLERGTYLIKILTDTQYWVGKLVLIP